jgi:hypothetical protein
MPTQQPVKVSFNKPYADYLAGGYLSLNSATQLKPITNPVEVSLPERRPAELKGLSPQIFANSVFQPGENKTETTQKPTPQPIQQPAPQPAQQPRVITPRPEAILQPSQTQLPITLPQLIQTPQVFPANVPLTTYPVPQPTLIPLQTPVAPLVTLPERARAYI